MSFEVDVRRARKQPTFWCLPWSAIDTVVAREGHREALRARMECVVVDSWGVKCRSGGEDGEAIGAEVVAGW